MIRRGTYLRHEMAVKYVQAAGISPSILAALPQAVVRGVYAAMPKYAYNVLDIQQALYKAGVQKLPLLSDFLSYYQLYRRRRGKFAGKYSSFPA